MTQPASDPEIAQQAARAQLAVLLAASGEGVLALMDALAKSLSVVTPLLQLSFLRFAMGTLFAAMVFFARAPQWPSAPAVRYNATRSALSVGANLSFFYGLSKLPLAEAMALSFAAPLCIAVLGVVLLKERFHWRIGLALAAGVAGMLVIVGGQLGTKTYAADAWLGAVAILISAVFFSFVIILLRARAKTDPLPLIVLFQNAGPALILAVPAALVWQIPAPNDLALFVLMGILGASGHTLFAHAFSRGEAARLAPVHYLALVWGTLYGWLFFGDLPGAATLIGAAIVIAATWATRRH